MVNLRFGARKTDAGSGKANVSFDFSRADATTGEQQAQGTHTLFSLPSATADAIMAAVTAHQAERVKSGKGHPAPLAGEGGMLSWSGISEDDAERIEQHLMDGLVKLAPALHAKVHGH